MLSALLVGLSVGFLDRCPPGKRPIGKDHGCVFGVHSGGCLSVPFSARLIDGCEDTGPCVNCRLVRTLLGIRLGVRGLWRGSEL
jgi:hypothetical protein